MISGTALVFTAVEQPAPSNSPQVPGPAAIPPLLPPPPPTRPRAWRAGDPLRISFLGFNPFGDGFDGRGLIDAGADHTFASLDTLGALRLIRRYFDLDGDGRLTPADGPPFDLRVTGYSFGAWSALQVVHALAPLGRHFRVRLGLVDPVNTFRSPRGWRLALRVLPVAAGRGLPVLWPAAGPAYLSRPPHVVWAACYFQTKGLIARVNGVGRRLPFRAKWFASQPVPGFVNHDKSDEVTAEAGHVEIAERYGRRLAAETFGHEENDSAAAR